MPTSIPTGSALAVKLFSVATFAEAQRAKTFRNSLIGPAPTEAQANVKLSNQTSASYPFVRVTDLAKGQGEKVSIDLFNVIKGKPTMGDKKLTGRLMSLSSSSQDIKVDQARGGVDSGGRMTQHRTVHNLRSIAKANLVGWNARFEDQLSLVHVAGSRGFQDDEDWVVPLAADSEFNDIVVNPILPPTFARRVIAGGGTTVTAIGTTDHLSLDDIDRMRAIIDDQPFPLQPVMLEDDPAANDEPLYVMYLSTRQWHFLQTNTTGQVWRTFLQNAWNRASSFTGKKKHPLFAGTPGMWNGILLRKSRRAIRFAAADIVVEIDVNGATQNVATTEPVDRAILLGAQALCCAYGKHGGSGYHYAWHEELTDHGNVLEVSTAMVYGCSKIQFTGSDGVKNDHGVMVLDSYAPVIA